MLVYLNCELPGLDGIFVERASVEQIVFGSFDCKGVIILPYSCSYSGITGPQAPCQG